MPFREQPLDRAGTPPQYPAPDWSRVGESARVFVPDDETVGWIVHQDDALAWFSAVDPDHLGYPIRRHVEDLLREGALDLTPAAQTWERVLEDTLHTTPQTGDLAEVLAEVQTAWRL